MSLGGLRNAGVSGSQRHVNREDAATAWHIADLDVSAVRSHGPTGDRKTETEPRAIRPSPVAEGSEHIRVAFGNAAAFVFNLDEKALALRIRAENHGTAGWGVLERIV